MRVFKRLWQRIFIYSFLLVLAASAAGFFLLNKNLTNKASSVVITFTQEMCKALTGQSVDEAARLLMRFNNHEAKFWLEDAQGALLAGRRFEGRQGKDWANDLHSPQYVDKLVLWETTLQKPLFLASIPCDLQDERSTLYATYMPFPSPPLETLFSPGAITLLLITSLLTLWMAVRVSAPLQKLQKEVARISSKPDELRHVSETGCDEIVDVSRAINRLVDSLKGHIGNMNDLVLNVSHEIRSPLTRMNFSTEMLSEWLSLCKQRESSLSPQEQKALKLAESNVTAIHKEISHLNKLVGDTLFAGKLALREPDELNAEVSLSTLCTALAERFSAMHNQKGIRFVWSIAPDVSVRGDSVLLSQVVTNLLDNAVTYVEGVAPKVQLRLSVEKETILLSIENTHTFLPQTVLDRLFEPYFRYEQKIGTGTGLGLSIVQNIVILHGGHIDVENVKDCVCFIVSLPLMRK